MTQILINHLLCLILGENDRPLCLLHQTTIFYVFILETQSCARRPPPLPVCIVPEDHPLCLVLQKNAPHDYLICLHLMIVQPLIFAICYPLWVSCLHLFSASWLFSVTGNVFWARNHWKCMSLRMMTMLHSFSVFLCMHFIIIYVLLVDVHFPSKFLRLDECCMDLKFSPMWFQWEAGSALAFATFSVLREQLWPDHI